MSLERNRIDSHIDLLGCQQGVAVGSKVQRYSRRIGEDRRSLTLTAYEFGLVFPPGF
jgi:hypothetical protein